MHMRACRRQHAVRAALKTHVMCHFLLTSQAACQALRIRAWALHTECMNMASLFVTHERKLHGWTMQFT